MYFRNDLDQVVAPFAVFRNRHKVKDRALNSRLVPVGRGHFDCNDDGLQVLVRVRTDSLPDILARIDDYSRQIANFTGIVNLVQYFPPGATLCFAFRDEHRG